MSSCRRSGRWQRASTAPAVAGGGGRVIDAAPQTSVQCGQYPVCREAIQPASSELDKDDKTPYLSCRHCRIIP